MDMIAVIAKRDLVPVEIPLLLKPYTGVVYLGVNRDPLPWEMRRPVRYGLNLILQGRLQIRDEVGRQTELHAGDAFQRVPRRCHASTPVGKYVECFVSVDAQSMDRLAALDCIDCSQQFLSCADPSGAVEAFVRLYEMLTQDLCPQNEILLHVAQWFTLFHGETSDADELVTAAKLLLAKRLGCRFRLNAIAAELGVSYPHLRARFRKQTRMSMGRWLIEQRMERARHLLGTCSVSEVAEVLGYSDAYTFSHQFTRHEGKSPRSFQAQLRSGS